MRSRAAARAAVPRIEAALALRSKCTDADRDGEGATDSFALAQTLYLAEGRATPRTAALTRDAEATMRKMNRIHEADQMAAWLEAHAPGL